MNRPSTADILTVLLMIYHIKATRDGTEDASTAVFTVVASPVPKGWKYPSSHTAHTPCTRARTRMRHNHALACGICAHTPPRHTRACHVCAHIHICAHHAHKHPRPRTHMPTLTCSHTYESHSDAYIQHMCAHIIPMRMRAHATCAHMNMPLTCGCTHAHNMCTHTTTHHTYTMLTCTQHVCTHTRTHSATHTHVHDVRND